MSVATASAGPLTEAAAGGSRNLAEVVAAPLRADLILQRQLFRGNEYYVIKDPLALTYFRLQQEEGFLISLLDGKRTLADIHRLFHARFPNKERTLEDLATFTNQMGAAGLLNINARRFVSVVRAQESMRRHWLMIWGKVLSSLIFFRIPLIDPSPWLGGLTRAIRFIWTRWFIGLCLAFMVWSAFWLFVNREAFTQNTVNFFSPENLILVWLTVIIVKTLHEFGHATTCRNFGGEVHEMGLCLICFTPAGYVDASDAWMMRQKTHKLYTTFAGIFTEFVIAGIAAHLWLHLPPGLAKNLAFNAMIVASVNTIFFNANPLMKFDGYYVVSDWLEIPNLRTKSMMFCSYHLQRRLFGYRNLAQERVLEDEQHSTVFVIYALLAYAYMMVIIYSLSQVFARFLTPFGLHNFGLTLGIFVQASFLVFPVFKVMADAFMADRADTVREEGVWRRIAKWLLPLLAGGAILAALPSRHRIEQQAVLVAADSERVGVEVGGVVAHVHVHTGEWVETDQPLVTLENPDVEAAARVAELAYRSATLRFSALQVRDTLRAASQAPAAANSLEAMAAARDRARRARSRLVLRAPSQGYVVTPDLARYVGRFLPPGFSAIRVADLRRFKLLIPLPEADAQLIAVGSRLQGRVRADGSPVSGAVTALPSGRAAWDDYHQAMLSAFGGPAPIELNANRAIAPPSFGLFIAEAELAEAPPGAIEGMRIKVAIDGIEATYGQRAWRWLVTLWRGRTSA